MATTVISAVDPTGAGDYLTLDAWVAAKKGNLVTRDTVEVAEIYSGGSVGALNLLRGDWTVDPTHYPVIRGAVGHRHGGVWSSSQAFIKAANPDDPYITIEVGYTQFGLGISAENNGNPGTGIQIGFTGAAVTPPLLIEGVICRAANGDPQVQLFQNNAGNPYTFRNCVFLKTAAQSVFESGSSATVEVLLYNSVLVAGAVGFHRAINFQAGTITEQNNYLSDSANCYDDGGGSGTINKGDHTATSTAEAVTAGLRNIPHDNTVFNGVGLNDMDYRLVVGTSPLLDVGADLTASGVTEDFIGTARPQGAAFDIGADEAFLPVVPGGPVFFIFGF